MESKFGKLLGSGASSDVYEYESDKVCKLYAAKHGIDLANWEYTKTNDAYKSGLPAPKVYEIIEHNGRFGLIMERFHGRTFYEVIFNHIQTSVENGSPMQELIDSFFEIFVRQIKDTAKVLFELHQKTCSLTVTVKESLMNSCRRNNYITQDEKDIIYKIIEDLPDSHNVCHGDPNPNNLIYHNDKILIIDWIDCGRGSPLYDITEYKLMVEYSDNPIGLPEEILNFYIEHKSEYIKIFMDEYIRLSNIDLSEIDNWIIPMLVSKMSGNNSIEKQQRLLDGIRNELCRL